MVASLARILEEVQQQFQDSADGEELRQVAEEEYKQRE